jgi:hypothetical protein
VAILHKAYLRLILAGRKTVESRLTRTARPPYGQVGPGERIYFKASAGPFMATAVAGRVDCRDGLTPEAVRELHREYNTAVCGDEDYWRGRRDSRFATFIHLHDVSPIDVGPHFTPSRWRAWFVLDEAADPLADVIVTAGALRNRYVYVPADCPLFEPAQRCTLVLPDGRDVGTELGPRRIFRWRGWRPLFEAHRLEAGHRVRFVHLGGHRYRVLFPDAPA